MLWLTEQWLKVSSLTFRFFKIINSYPKAVSWVTDYQGFYNPDLRINLLLK